MPARWKSGTGVSAERSLMCAAPRARYAPAMPSSAPRQCQAPGGRRRERPTVAAGGPGRAQDAQVTSGLAADQADDRHQRAGARPTLDGCDQLANEHGLGEQHRGTDQQGDHGCDQRAPVRTGVDQEIPGTRLRVSVTRVVACASSAVDPSAGGSSGAVTIAADRTPGRTSCGPPADSPRAQSRCRPTTGRGRGPDEPAPPRSSRPPGAARHSPPGLAAARRLQQQW